MKAKKMIIAVFAVVLAMQMTGCKGTTIDTKKPVVIEVSVSENDIVPKAELTWTELGKLTSYEEMRTAVDTAFGNEIVDGLKYGPFYIDADGTQCSNNTLQVVLGNRYVAEMLATGGNVDIESLDADNLGAIKVTEDTAATTEESDATAEDDESGTTTMEDSINSSLDATYTDLSDSDYTPALFNAYFNLLPDSTPNYFNGGDTLSRAEAMTLVTRATTPVGTLGLVDGFEEAVAGTDYDQYINYAAQQNDNSYINTKDKSLTKDNFKGAMSRAEFVYLIMNTVYSSESVSKYDASSVALKDCSNAGDLSTELKIADADRCAGYTLSYSLEHTDKGVCEELYKPLAMAVDKGIIPSETRWNEGITKSEAIEIVVNAFQVYYDEQGYLMNNGDKGSTQALEAAALTLWEKQDANDMSCTKEEFIADYVKEVGGSSLTAEEFEKGIEGKYSIKFAKEQEEKKKQEYIDQIWGENKDNLTCDKEKFKAEYDEFTKGLKPEEISENEFIKHITEKYGKPEEKPAETPSNNNSSSNSGSSNGSSGGSSGGSSDNGSSGWSSGGGSSNNGSSGSTGGSTGGSTSNGGSSNNGGGNSSGGGFSDPGSGGSTGNTSGNNGDVGAHIPDDFEWNDDAVVDVVE